MATMHLQYTTQLLGLKRDNTRHKNNAIGLAVPTLAVVVLAFFSLDHMVLIF